MSLEFGLVLPIGPRPGDPQGWARTVDAILAGLAPRIDGLWMTDHFFWGDQPTYEAWATLAYAAARWPGYRLGPMVSSQNYRNPALLAKIGGTLQSLSGGKLVMAIGAGWKEDEFRAYGYPFPSPGVRVAQLEDTLEIVTRMWREPGPVTYTGAHYSITNAMCEPRPDPMPALLVGGGGTKTLRLAARFADWWNMPDAPVETVAERMTVLDQHCVDLGRDPRAIRRSWFGRLAVGSSEAEALALSEGRWTRANAIVGTPAQVREQLQAYHAIGVDYFMLDMLGAEDPERCAMICELLSGM